MRTSFKRVARTIYETSRSFKERLLSTPALAIWSTPEDFQVSAFGFTVAGVPYAKAAETGIGFTAAHVVGQGQYGAILVEIDTSGVVATKVGEATQTTLMTYATGALAIAALPAVTASKRILGHILINAKNNYATLTTALAGADNDLVFTAVAPYSGTAGNAITVSYVNPGANNAVLGVVVTGTAIVVNLGTDGGGTITTTGDLLKAAIAASPAAVALVGTVVDAPANDGSGLVIALAVTPLAGGVALGWTANTDDMTNASDVTTAVFTSYFGNSYGVSNVGSSWMEKTPAFQEELGRDVGSYVWTGVIPTLDASIDSSIFLSVVDSLRSRATLTP